MRSAESVAAMLCPVCRTGLTLSDRAGVEIDYCARCRGVWLDRGELDKIIEYSAGSPTSEVRDRDRHRHDHYSGGYRDDDDYRFRSGKRRKSFLSDLFD